MRAGSALQLGTLQPLPRAHAACLQRGDDGIGRPQLCCRRGGEQRAVPAPFTVDAMLGAEGLDVEHRLLGGAYQAQRLSLAEQPCQREELGRPGQNTTTVAAARAGAADVGLEHDDVKLGARLLGEDRGPQPGEATADDAQPGARVVLKGHGGIADLSGERVVTTFTNAVARLVAHEIDHLSGLLYTDRMPADARLVPVEEYSDRGQPWRY